jgi:hypothetical protein
MSELYDYEDDDGNVYEGLSILEALKLKESNDAKRSGKEGMAAIDTAKKDLQASAAYERNMGRMQSEQVMDPTTGSMRQIKPEEIQQRLNSPGTQAWSGPAQRKAPQILKDLGFYDKLSGNKQAEAFRGKVESDYQQEQGRKATGQIAEKMRTGGYRQGDKLNRDEMTADLVNAYGNTGKPDEAMKFLQDTPYKEQKAMVDEAGVDLDNKKFALDEKESNLRMKKIEAEIAEIGSDELTPEKIVAIEGTLRKEFIGLNKAFFDVRDSFGRVKATSAEPSAAGDLSLIFNYMKMLDPGSVVRESEFATAQNAAGVPERVRNQWNRTMSGERLGEKQRTDFLTQAKNLYDSQLNIYKKSAANYMGLAVQYGGDPSRVVVDMTAGSDAPPKPAGPVKITNDADYDALDSGSEFIDPNGVKRRKP